MIIGGDEVGDRVMSLEPPKRAAICRDVWAVLLIGLACIAASRKMELTQHIS